jgi:membrane-associated phospholipid phosphatase
MIDLTQLMGIVSFPSYHATLPVILAWAQRDVRGWRFVAPVWAGVTILATPVFGGHYGVDVLAGLVMAVLSLSAAPWMARRRIGWRGNLPTTASHVG